MVGLVRVPVKIPIYKRHIDQCVPIAFFTGEECLFRGPIMGRLPAAESHGVKIKKQSGTIDLYAFPADFVTFFPILVANYCWWLLVIVGDCWWSEVKWSE